MSYRIYGLLSILTMLATLVYSTWTIKIDGATFLGVFVSIFFVILAGITERYDELQRGAQFPQQRKVQLREEDD